MLPRVHKRFRLDTEGISDAVDVIKVADYIIDIGPEGGRKGGTVVCEGTPEEVAKNKKSFTAQFLKLELQ